MFCTESPAKSAMRILTLTAVSKSAPEDVRPAAAAGTLRRGLDSETRSLDRDRERRIPQI